MESTYLESKTYKKETKQMFHFTISLYTKKFGGEMLEHLRWEGYKLEWLVKWRWYFEYRAALLKVKNPKCDVVSSWGPFESEIQQDILVVTIMKLKRDITTAKRMRTKFFNAIEKYKANQKTILIADWENPQYLKAVSKLEFYSNKLKELQNELNRKEKTSEV